MLIFLFKVIIPIVPEYLKFIENNNKPSFLKYFASDTGNETVVNQTVNSTLVGGKHHGDKFSYSQNDVLIGFLFATKPFIQLIVNPFSGTLIDHIGYDLPMICGLSIQFISTIIFAYTNSFMLLFVARGLQGVGSALADTSGFAMIAHCFKEHEERTKSLGNYLFRINYDLFLDGLDHNQFIGFIFISREKLK